MNALLCLHWSHIHYRLVYCYYALFCFLSSFFLFHFPKQNFSSLELETTWSNWNFHTIWKMVSIHGRLLVIWPFLHLFWDHQTFLATANNTLQQQRFASNTAIYRPVAASRWRYDVTANRLSADKGFVCVWGAWIFCDPGVMRAAWNFLLRACCVFLTQRDNLSVETPVCHCFYLFVVSLAVWQFFDIRISVFCVCDVLHTNNTD